MFSDIDDIAKVLDMISEEMIKEAADYFEEDVDYIGYSEICQYVTENDYEAIEQAYKENLLECMSEYIAQAEQIIEQFEDEN